MTMKRFCQRLLLIAALLSLGLGIATAQTNVIFEETFDACDGTGGNDGQWSGKLGYGNAQNLYPKWTFDGGATICDQCIYVGTASKKSYAMTPALTGLDGSATMTFRAGAWNGTSESTTIKVSITKGSLTYNGTTATSVTVELVKGEFSDYTMTITGGTSASKIKFDGTAQKNNRYFLDEVRVFTEEEETPETCGSIAEMKALKEGTSASLVLKDAKVLKVFTTAEGAQEVYVRDATGAICLSDVGLSVDNLSEGDVLNGTIAGVFTLVGKRPTVTAQTSAVVPNVVTKASGEKAEPVAVDLASVSSANYCDLISLTGGTAELTDDGCKVVSGDHGVLLNDVFSTGMATPYAGARLEIAGICLPQTSGDAICPLQTSDILYIFDEHSENAFGTAEGVSAKLLRTLSSEYWNTFCPPFGISLELVESVFGTGTVVAKYTGDTDNTMNFQQVEAMEAGAAYLMKPAQTVENPVFSGVGIAAGTEPATSAGTTYLFNGVISPMELDTQTDLFITKSGTVSKIATGKNTIYGMRAYIRCPNVDENRPKMSIGETPTSIQVVDRTAVTRPMKVFNLQGQELGTTMDALPKGIYIVDGKKVGKH